MPTTKYNELLRAQHGAVRVQMAEKFLEAAGTLGACYYGRTCGANNEYPFVGRVWTAPGGATVDLTPAKGEKSPWSSDAERKDAFDTLNAAIWWLYDLAFHQKAQAAGIPRDEYDPVIKEEGKRKTELIPTYLQAARTKLALWGITFANVPIVAVPEDATWASPG